MKVAVTGATGHIGINLIAQLTERGFNVRALYHQPEHKRFLSSYPIETQQIDVCDPATLEHAFDGCDIVFHLAAVISIEGDKGGKVAEINAEGTRHVLAAAKAQGVKRVIHTSSIHALSRFPKDQVFDDSKPLANDARHSAYDLAKAQAERYVQQAVSSGQDVVVLRPVGVVGGLDVRNSLICQALLSYYNREMLGTIAGGFNFVHVDDVVAALIAAIDKGRTGEAYLIAGYWTSIARLAKIVEEITGVKAPRFCSPLWLAKLGLPAQWFCATVLKRKPLYTAESLRMLDSFMKIDDSKARRELGHNPQSVESAIFALFSWLQQTGKIAPMPEVRPTLGVQSHASHI